MSNTPQDNKAHKDRFAGARISRLGRTAGKTSKLQNYMQLTFNG